MEVIKLLKFMLKEKKQVFIAFLLGFVAAVSSIGLMGAGGYLISQAALQPPLYTLTMTILLVRAFGLGRVAARYGERYFSHKATFSILGNIRMYVYDRLEPVVPKLFSYYRSGDILSRVVADVDRIQFFFLRVVYPPIVMVVVFLATCIFLINFSLSMTALLVLGLFIVAVVIPYVFSSLLNKDQPFLREKNSKLWNHAADILHGFTDLKTNLQLSNKGLATEEASRELIETQEKSSLLQLKGETVSFFTSLLVTWCVLFIGVYLVANGSLNGVFLAMLVLVSLTVFETSTPIASLPSHINESREAGKRLFSMIESDEVKKMSDKEDGEKVEFADYPPGIKFKEVNFTYPNNERQTLKNVSFTIEPGEKVAVVGHSGSGKSTLLQLLLQFHTGYEGQILIGDHELADIPAIENRKLYTAVPQENHFFYDTVRNNLLLANPEATDERLKDMLEAVSLNKISLDDQLLEGGKNISGGERQRLSIARMLLKDAPLILLDELTTGIDAMTERDILSVLWPLVEEKSLIYITHRLRDLDKVDKVIVMDRGEIREYGSYKSLLEDDNSFFSRLKKLEEELVL